MAIKFDELLEALDPSLDEFEEDLNSMWIIIPTEKRYDDLTASDYDEFIDKYGTFNSRQACWNKIDELAPDRWDAFIPLRIDGVNEAYETDIEIKAKPGDPYNANEKVVSRPEDPYYTGDYKSLNEDIDTEKVYNFITNKDIDFQTAIDIFPNVNLDTLCKYFECDEPIEYPSDLIDIVGLEPDEILNVILELASDKDIDEFIETFNEYINESLNESYFDSLYDEDVNKFGLKVPSKLDDETRKILAGLYSRIKTSFETELSTFVEGARRRTNKENNKKIKQLDRFYNYSENKYIEKLFAIISSTIANDMLSSLNESLNEAKYWNDKQNNEFYNDIRYKVDEAVYQIMRDIFKDLRIDKLAAQVHNLVPEYDPSWATHKRDDDNNLRLHKVRTGLSASLLDELSDKMNPGSLDRTVNNLRKY